MKKYAILLFIMIQLFGFREPDILVIHVQTYNFLDESDKMFILKNNK
jgi:hypothetical protein